MPQQSTPQAGTGGGGGGGSEALKLALGLAPTDELWVETKAAEGKVTHSLTWLVLLLYNSLLFLFSRISTTPSHEKLFGIVRLNQM